MSSPPKDAVPSPSKQEGQPPAAGAAQPPAKKKFQNGWTREIEDLMSVWADKAMGYKWMHERMERICSSRDYGFMFPVIILSTITGAANFAMDSILTDPDHKKYAQLGLGGVSIVTGIISTIANRLGYASQAEAHRAASVRWGKFQRLIDIELKLHPNERNDSMQFLKSCRAELDRLIEQTPTISKRIIDACKKEFRDEYPTVVLPEIVGGLTHTKVFVDTNSRLKQMAKEAAITIQQKKGVLKQIVLDDLEPRISRVIEHSTLPAIKEELQAEIRKAAAQAAREAVAAGARGPVGVAKAPATVEQEASQRKEEVQRIAMSGVVAEMKRRLASGAPPEPSPVSPKQTMATPSLTAVANGEDRVVIHVQDEESGEESEEDAEHEAAVLAVALRGEKV